VTPFLLRRYVPAGLGLASATLLACAAEAQQSGPENWQLGFQAPVSPVMQNVHDFHTFVLVIITAIVLLVTVLLGYCMWRFNASRHPVPSRTTHNTVVEVLWTVVPVLVLVAIAIPSFRILYQQQVIPQADLTVKAVGHQWYWSYEYPDLGEFSFDSLMVQDRELKDGQPRLLAVDNDMVVPVNRTVRVITTSADVIHAFALPAFGVKVDSVPGRLNEAWFLATQTGVYYGQCSELCGRDHAYMPIAIRVVTDAEFQTWTNEAKQRFALAQGRARVAALHP
jgi:cytochrome c oxidase subunit 2